jgi:Family of unknown function (DUF6459)
LTASIAQPLPHTGPRPHLSPRPVLRRLVDILPRVAPALPDPPPEAPPAADPAAPVLVERVLRAAVEILDGRRPAQQLSAVLRPDVLAHLITLQQVAGHLKPRVHKVFARSQTPGVVEAVAVVALSTGVRALAARFEEHVDGDGRRWRCTALQLRLTAGDVAIRRDPRTRRP